MQSWNLWECRAGCSGNAKVQSVGMQCWNLWKCTPGCCGNAGLESLEVQGCNLWKCSSGIYGSAELGALGMQSCNLWKCRFLFWCINELWSEALCLCLLSALRLPRNHFFGVGRLLWRMAADCEDSLSVMGMALGCSSHPTCCRVPLWVLPKPLGQ